MGVGLPGLFFGFLFTSSGLLCVGGAAWSVMVQLGIVVVQGNVNQPLNEFLLGAGGLLLIGGAHFLCGTVLLITLRSTFDRAAHVVTVRSGWLGLRRQHRYFSEFQNVEILPCTPGFFGPPRNEPWFDLTLRDHQGSHLVVGQVSRSRDVARTVGEEMAEFAYLPYVDAPQSNHGPAEPVTEGKPAPV